MDMPSRATQPELLDQRIAENKASQEIDLATWIFERLEVRPQDQVLELCCGTGGQTLSLLERLGDGGSVIGLDISSEALKTLEGKLGAPAKAKLSLVVGSLDDLAGALEQSSRFNLIFCAYGLYYSADAIATLEQACDRLTLDGRIAIVGPFGPNNKPLFDLLRESGVSLPKPVISSSQTFMLETVLPWAAVEFESVSINSMVNRVHWATPDKVLNYWQNTTFYDAQRRKDFEFLLRKHFETHREFVNEKWVMMLEMKHARS
jgi:ubiquinone/menaquinone biosynthesis C-methylase UbiE